jgi:hypothetical protein
LLAVFRHLSLPFIRDPIPMVYPAAPSFFGRPFIDMHLRWCDLSSINKRRRRPDSPPGVWRKGLSCGATKVFSAGFSGG